MRFRPVNLWRFLVLGFLTLGGFASPGMGQETTAQTAATPTKPADAPAKPEDAPADQPASDPARPNNVVTTQIPSIPTAPIPDENGQLATAVKDLSAAVSKLSEELRLAKEAATTNALSDLDDESSAPEVPPPSDSTIDPTNKGLLPTVTLDAAQSAGRLAVAGTAFPLRVSTGARKIHLIHFALTRDPSNALPLGAQANVAFLNSLFNKQTENCPDRRGQVINVNGDAFTVPTVTSTLAGLAGVTNQDTLIVYFSTHGGFDASRNDQFFQTMNGGFYSRRRVLQNIQGKARLTVLMSDACTTPFVAPPSAALATAAAEPQTNALFDLLFFYQGTVSISSSTFPNPSYYLNEATTAGGGIFTRGFCKSSLYGPLANEAVGGTRGWESFFADLQRRGSVNDPRGNQRPTLMPTP